MSDALAIGQDLISDIHTGDLVQSIEIQGTSRLMGIQAHSPVCFFPENVNDEPLHACASRKSPNVRKPAVGKSPMYHEGTQLRNRGQQRGDAFNVFIVQPWVPVSCGPGIHGGAIVRSSLSR